MRASVLLGLTLLSVFAVGCANETDDGSAALEDDELVSSAPRAFDQNTIGGREKRTFTTPRGVTEVCAIPAHFSEEGFSGKDTKKENKLCRVDFNGAPGQGDAIPAGLLPKQNSTNPATDVHEITAQVGRDVVETFAEANARDRKGDKLGRLKSSLDPARYDRTSSYAPSIVGYYGTSRMLGNIAEVTPAVWRTLEVSHHAKVAEMGQRMTITGSQIVKRLWATFLQADNGESKGALTYTADGTQLYGAFIPSVSGDEKDREIDTQAALTGSPRYRRLIDASPVSRSVGRDFKSAVEGIVPMQGIVEMLVLDAMMLQGDRLSGDNVSYVQYVYFQKPDGSVDKMSKKDFDEVTAERPAEAPQNVINVKKLYLNDVDAGLVVKNAESFQNGGEYGLLKRVAHISPDLYARIQKHAALVGDPSFERFTKSEWRYTDRDWVRYQTMTKAVAALLKDRCSSGALTLDLDIQAHVAGTSLGARQGCQ